MRRSLVGVLVAVLVAAVLVWFFWLRDRGKPDAKPDAAKGRSAEIKPQAPADAAAASTDSPRLPINAPNWVLDVDKEGKLTLEGQVVGPDGKGVAKAEVWLGSVPPRTVTTEDDGTFSFDRLVPRAYALSAKSGDLIGGPIAHKLTDKSDPVVVKLSEGAAVQVTVIDDDKKPMAGVAVSSGFTVEAQAKTDAKGEATLKPVSPGYALVEAKADGYAPGVAYAPVGSAGSTAKLTITMHRGYAVSGRVVDDAGKPIAKAYVVVAGTSWGGWERWGREGAAKDPSSATTDEKGNFKIAAVASGTHILLATDGEHAPAKSAQITVDNKPLTGVTITMKAGGTLAGTVVDAKGAPVPNATVRIAGAGEMGAQVAARQATADDKGAFEIRAIARAKMQARADHDNAASKVVDFDLTEKAEVKDMKLVLDVTGTISGIVVDDKGAPIAEVQVNAFPDFLAGASTDGVSLAGMASATTDGGGRFVVSGLVETNNYKLWAARPNGQWGGWGGSNNPSAKPGDKDVRITLASPGNIKGSIAIEGMGTPKVATVQIGWQPPTPAQDGKFEMKELDPGTYDVKFQGPEFAITIKRDVKVEAGKTTDLGTVTVHRGRKIRGKVIDSAGKPVAGAKVKVGEMIVFSDDEKPDAADDDDEEQTGPTRSAVSDSDGQFSIIGIGSKATTVAADHSTAGRSPSLPIGDGTADPPPVTLQLRGFGSISGKVTQKGKPLAGVSVTHSSKSGGTQLSGAQTDDEGNFVMKKVPEGQVVLQAMQQKMMSLKSTTVTVTVTAGKETKANIDIPIGQVTLAVTIKPATGAKLDAAQVFLFTGTLVAANGKQLLDSFIAGGAQGMKFWFGEGKPLPEFDELVPGNYSICSVPITGDMNDPIFMQRINENSQTLKVYCRQVKITDQPIKQSATQELPSMTPLPAPTTN